MLTGLGFSPITPEGREEIRIFNPHPLAVAYLAFDLHFSGATDASIPTNRDWSLWRLTPQAVREQLDELGRHGLWVFQVTEAWCELPGSVPLMEEAVDVLAGLDV